ncbi:hypothetical protein Tco_0648282 [Tanacetum coccineum]
MMLVLLDMLGDVGLVGIDSMIKWKAVSEDFKGDVFWDELSLVGSAIWHSHGLQWFLRSGFKWSVGTAACYGYGKMDGPNVSWEDSKNVNNDSKSALLSGGFCETEDVRGGGKVIFVASF